MWPSVPPFNVSTSLGFSYTSISGRGWATAGSIASFKEGYSALRAPKVYPLKPVGSLVRFFFSSRRRHTKLQGDWSSDVCSSDLYGDHRDYKVTGVQTCALPICRDSTSSASGWSRGRRRATRTS